MMPNVLSERYSELEPCIVYTVKAESLAAVGRITVIDRQLEPEVAFVERVQR